MGIDVYWKDERGKILGMIEDNDVLSGLCRVFSRQSGSACLRFIDPAGDACFNQQQIPVLLTEMRHLLPAVSAPRAQTHLQAVIGLLEGATRSHTYVWFVGD